ncbi:MAG TPA: hypothetical protein VN372_15565 [Methanospirillum sp.]|nr:hypothetical protein [Methanospirillum sp.]
MREQIRIIWYGLITWLVPFLVSIPFYSSTGELLLDQHFFKSIMIVVGSFTGALLVIRFFRSYNGPYLNRGIRLGFSWLAINLILDLLILVPMSGMDLQIYITQIGMRYLVIPVMAVMAGMIADDAAGSCQD